MLEFQGFFRACGDVKTDSVGGIVCKRAMPKRAAKAALLFKNVFCIGFLVPGNV